MTATRFSEELIAQYLLGELAENEQVQIEDEAFRDPAVMEDVLAVEQDLLDEYAQGGLNAAQRVRFESHFLASEERKKKLFFAKALESVITETGKAPQRAVATESRSTSFWSFLTRPVMAYGFAAATVVLLIFGAWMFLQSFRLRTELKQLRATSESQNANRQQLESDLAKERERSEQLQAEVNQRQADVAGSNLNANQTPPPKSLVNVALALLPGVSRGSNSMPQVAIGKDVNTLRLQVGIDPDDDFPTYRVELRNGQGRTVLAANKVRARSLASGRTVVIVVPAATLSGGTYEVALQGVNDAGTAEPLGFYYFRVVPK